MHVCVRRRRVGGTHGGMAPERLGGGMLALPRKLGGGGSTQKGPLSTGGGTVPISAPPRLEPRASLDCSHAFLCLSRLLRNGIMPAHAQHWRAYAWPLDGLQPN